MEYPTKELGVGGLIAHWNALGAEWSAMARRFSQYGDEEAALRCHERAAMVADMIGQLREVWGMATAARRDNNQRDAEIERRAAA